MSVLCPPSPQSTTYKKHFQFPGISKPTPKRATAGQQKLVQAHFNYATAMDRRPTENIPISKRRRDYDSSMTPSPTRHNDPHCSPPHSAYLPGSSYPSPGMHGMMAQRPDHGPMMGYPYGPTWNSPPPAYYNYPNVAGSPPMNSQMPPQAPPNPMMLVPMYGAPAPYGHYQQHAYQQCQVVERHGSPSTQTSESSSANAVKVTVEQARLWRGKGHEEATQKLREQMKGNSKHWRDYENLDGIDEHGKLVIRCTQCHLYKSGDRNTYKLMGRRSRLTCDGCEIANGNILCSKCYNFKPDTSFTMQAARMRCDTCEKRCLQSAQAKGKAASRKKSE